MLIYGTGGHAKVIAEIARLRGMNVAGFFADNVPDGVSFKDLPVLSYKGDYTPHLPIIIAIGSNSIRKRIAGLISHPSITLIHPAAIISPDTVIGEGTAVLAGAVLQADSEVGKHCIINVSSCVEHDAVVGDYVHIGPNCYIGGAATIGEGALIGAGSVIMRNTNIAPWTEIPPGSVIK